jgi:hypothetical protein
MARKRKPLVVNGVTVELDAPGLNVFERRGRVELYWKPNAEARKRGYEAPSKLLKKIDIAFSDLLDPSFISDIDSPFDNRC